VRRNVTDRILLKEIYDTYLQTFCDFDEESKSRSNKIYVPIDCEAIAKKLGLDIDIVFGRLYYHLDRKHGYTDDQGAQTHLFSMRVGGDHHVIHFPLLSAVLADLELAHHRFTLPLMLSLIALSMSVFNFVTGL
jgi:hypothetical protein